MYILLICAILLGIAALAWMNVQTKKYQPNDRTMWLILAFCVPIPAVLLFYFTKMRSNTVKN